MKKVSLIVPVFNEEDSIPIFYNEVRKKLNLDGFCFEIIFINDGSQDKTEYLIDNLSKEDVLVKTYSFTRNFGKEAALMCGIENCTGDCAIPIDVDLQDPLWVIPLMIKDWEEGAECVLARRCDRSSDSYFKRKTAEWFYKLHNLISDVNIEANVGDFRLLSKQYIDSIKKLSESNLFMKGILSWPGGGKNVTIVNYKRDKRIAGRSKFNAWKLWNLALEGVTSFSTVPLRIWTYIGAFCSFFSFAYLIVIVFCKIFFNNPVPGYASLMSVILFFGGIQLIGIGVLGEYIGRIYIETKKRPRYILKNK